MNVPHGVRAAAVALALLTAAPARAGCPASTQEIATEISAAETAFSAMDRTTFLQARDRAHDDLSCLTELMTPADAAAFHRLEALQGFVAKDHEAVVQSFRASQSVQPNFQLPSSLAPEGNPLRAMYDEAKTRPPAEDIPIAPPKDTVLYVDGVKSGVRPSNRPAILQVLTSDGKVRWTYYLVALGVPPDWASIPAVNATHTKVVSVPLIIAAGGAAAVSGTLLGLGFASRGTYMDTSTPYDQLDGLRKRTNTLGYAGESAAVVALGLGVTSFLVVKF